MSGFREKLQNLQTEGQTDKWTIRIKFIGPCNKMGSKMEDIFKRKTKGTTKGKGTVEQKPKCLNKTQKDKIFFEKRGKRLNKREKNGKI